MNGLSLHVENYRAVRRADVELADLTVLAGVNASGKSTIARLFHRLICIEANYERYAAQVAIDDFVHCVLRPLRALLSGVDLRLSRRLSYIEQFLSQGNFSGFDQMLERVRRDVDDLCQERSVQSLLSSPQLLQALDRRNAGSVDDREKVSELGVRDWIEKSLRGSEKWYNEAIARGKGSSFLFWAKPYPMTPLELPFSTSFRFVAGDETIFDSSKSELPFKPIFTPHQSLYIARPAVDFPIVSPKKVVLNDIEYERLKQESETFNLHLGELMGGAVDLPEDSTDEVRGDQLMFSFGGHDKIPVSECADGIKSISAILMLDKCGLLQPQSDSLLIIDEPEVHLHPQWVVEMARILVHLAKRRRVRVLVTTHSPDMVHALRDFAENENFGASTRFYLAKEDREQKGVYNYESLGMNIGPIFTVFNRAKESIASISKALRERDAL